jgi:hypothetical protein
MLEGFFLFLLAFNHQAVDFDFYGDLNKQQFKKKLSFDFLECAKIGRKL